MKLDDDIDVKNQSSFKSKMSTFDYKSPIHKKEGRRDADISDLNQDIVNKLKILKSRSKFKRKKNVRVPFEFETPFTIKES